MKTRNKKIEAFSPPYLGSAYYPEDWPAEQVDEDARLMREAGLTVARIGEFAWSKMEPKEGKFDFKWLHAVVEKLEKYGIATVLGTPTATPPIWLTKKYPEILWVFDNGVKMQHGTRRHVCSNNSTYRKHCARIVTAMAKEFGRDPRVISWQIDNEIYPVNRGCCCEVCQEKFQEAMRQRYGTIDKLNEAWGNNLFSIAYQSFGQLEAPRSDTWHHPSLTTAWMRFQSDSIVDFVDAQADILRKFTTAPIGTDMMPVNGLGYEQTFRKLDVVQFNHYDDAESLWRPIFWFDHARTIKDRPFWNTETATCWNGGLTLGKKAYKEPGFCRVNSWLPIALGGEANLYWLWRAHWSGHEVMHGSVVTSAGRPLHIFDEVREVADGFRRCADFINGTKPVRSGMAMHFSSAAWWTFMFQPIIEGFNYQERITGFHRVISEAGWRPDVIDPAADLSAYKVVCSPFLPVLDEGGLRGRLLEWIVAGGVWIAGPLTDIRKLDATKFVHAPFGSLEEWTGAYCRYELPGLPRDFKMKWKSGSSSFGSLWYDVFDSRDAEPLAVYTEGPGKGLASVVRQKVGKGAIILLGTLPLKEELLKIVEDATRGTGVASGPEASPNLLAVRREGAELSGMIAVETAGKPATVRLERAMRNLLNGKMLKAGTAKVAPFEVMVLV